MTETSATKINPWGKRAQLALVVFALIAGFFLLAEHRAHVLPYLPWLLLAACPLMHMFMHHGHGRHGKHGERPAAAQGEPPTTAPATRETAPGGHHHHGGSAP